MTLPSFTAALGAPSTTPMPALADGPLSDRAGATADAVLGGFAAALDEAAASLDALATGALEAAMPAMPAMPVQPVPPEVPVPTLSVAVPTTLTAALPTAFSTLDATAPAVVPTASASHVAAGAPGSTPPVLRGVPVPTIAPPFAGPPLDATPPALVPMASASDVAAVPPGWTPPVLRDVPVPTIAPPFAGPPLDATPPALVPMASASDAAAVAPGWPPPGLSSLFTADSLLCAQVGSHITTPPQAHSFRSPGADLPNAQAGVQEINEPPVLLASVTAIPEIRTPTRTHWDIESLPSTLASVRGFTLNALLPEAVDSRVPDVASPSPGTGLALDRGTTSTMAAGAIPMPIPQANAGSPDALAAALARQPAALHLPVADDSDAAALIALTETLGIERAPDIAQTAAAPLTPVLHKLDLAQAFPAPVPLPSPRFAEEVGMRLQWIAEQHGGEATLRISPDGLGPVEIRLKLDGDRVELGFTTTQQDTRQALQDALPKLREMLAQQGLQLGHADVGHKHAQSSNDEARKTAGGAMEDDIAEAGVRPTERREATLVIGRGGRGVLDLYA